MPSKPASQLQRGDVVLVDHQDWPRPVYGKVTGTRAGKFTELMPPELQKYASQEPAIVVHVDYETAVRIGEGADDVTRHGSIYHAPTDLIRYRKGNS